MFKNKEEPLEIDRETWNQLREFRKAAYRQKYRELERYSKP